MMGMNHHEPRKSFIHGTERKFGMAVLSFIFIILFLGGALLLWDRNRAIRSTRDLVAETTVLEEVIKSLQDELSHQETFARIEPVDTQQHQAIMLQSGDLYVGKVTKQADETVTVTDPVKPKRNQNMVEEPNPPQKNLTLRLDDIRLLQNIRLDIKTVEHLRNENI